MSYKECSNCNPERYHDSIERRHDGFYNDFLVFINGLRDTCGDPGCLLHDPLAEERLAEKLIDFFLVQGFCAACAPHNAKEDAEDFVRLEKELEIQDGEECGTLCRCDSYHAHCTYCFQPIDEMPTELARLADPLCSKCAEMLELVGRERLDRLATGVNFETQRGFAGWILKLCEENEGDLRLALQEIMEWAVEAMEEDCLFVPYFLRGKEIPAP